MTVKLARAAAERSNVSQDVAVAARPGNRYICIVRMQFITFQEIT
jgi:hypothetical protein